MKKLLLGIFLSSLFCTAFAQKSDHYTYQSDRRFLDIQDLIGFNFVPGALEIVDQLEKELDPGEYSFGITQNNLYVDGPEIKGVYNLNNTVPTEYGYKAVLMNARDPMMQGHLKVILNPVGYVEALVFKRSNKEAEMIFFLNQIPKNLAAKETDYFTDLYELQIEATDSLWGKTVMPFFLMHDDISVQQRLHAKDSTSISFEEEIEIVDKSKKKKRKKKRKKKKQSEDEADSEEMEEEESEEEEAPPLTREEILAMDEAELKERDIELNRSHYLIRNAIVTYDDGSVEEVSNKYKIEKVVEREDREAGKGEDRYQWEVKIYKKDSIYLYFRSDRTLSSIEFGPKRYLMRGY